MLSIPVHTITIVKNIIFLSSILFLFFHAGAQAGDLLVTVEGIKSEQGNVRIALFNNAQGFPKNSIHGQFFTSENRFTDLRVQKSGERTLCSVDIS